ncbi:MAG: hypothetical protein CBC55_04000 [Gammaproteobacteria bacterium TMED95]|nr:MAG: hypothetical protein CBC55_04000 [Gammaproteobacteria bacterium TMED95]
MVLAQVFLILLVVEVLEAMLLTPVQVVEVLQLLQYQALATRQLPAEPEVVAQATNLNAVARPVGLDHFQPLLVLSLLFLLYKVVVLLQV